MPDKIVPTAQSNANRNFENIVSVKEAANTTNTVSPYKHQSATLHQRSVQNPTKPLLCNLFPRPD